MTTRSTKFSNKAIKLILLIFETTRSSGHAISTAYTLAKVAVDNLQSRLEEMSAVRTAVTDLQG